MPLRKTNAELLIAKGIEQKVPDVIVPDESLSRAENVDFGKVGIARKRQGFVRNSNLVLGAGVLDEMRRLAVRQRREVLCVTETVTSIGSSAGVGTAGDTIFSYSEETERWIARGKMPRPNLDVLWTSGVATGGNLGLQYQMVCGGVDNYVCVAYQAAGFETTRVVVFDVGGDVNATLRESPTVVFDTSFPVTGASTLAGWAQAGGRVWLVYGSGGHTTAPSAGDRTAARAFRPDTVTFDDVETVLDASQSIRAVSTDGTFIYTMMRFATGGWEVRKYDSNLLELAAKTENIRTMAGEENAIDARGGYVDIVRHDTNTGDVYISRLRKTNLIPILIDAYVTTGSVSASNTARGNVTICTTSETDAVILWANQNSVNITTQPTYLSVGLMDMNTGALKGFFNHMALVPYSQPFIHDGRVYFVAMHTTGMVRPNASPTNVLGTKGDKESFMCFQIPLDAMNPNNVPFPCAQWDYGNVITKTSFFGSVTFGSLWLSCMSHYQVGSAVYLVTNIATTSGQTKADFLPAPRLVRLEMGDATHRWRNDEFHDYTAFAGGVPYVYDGTRTYELSTALHAPAVLAFGASNGGTLPDATQYYLQLAMLFTDGNGRECWSPPSEIVSFTTASPNQSGYIIAAPVTTTMKTDLGNGAYGRMRLYCFIATASAPNEFKVATDPVEIYPQNISPVGFGIAFEPDPANAQMYTAGFELDNHPAPPCRALVVHSGRLFVIASDTNEVAYTKPFRNERGPEFALGQRIPLPDKGTALASINDRLAIFTHRSVLAVGGDGPDVTGNPPDAFSRPVVISPDYGCVEYCAVGRTPLGVIFRGHQGFYLLTMGFEVQYIGGSVEDITSQWQATRSIVHDQKSACCRITGWTGDRSEELCFWYDTKRWSMNLLASDIVDSVALGDNLLMAVSDTTVALASRYRLGARAGVEYQDFDMPYEQVLETGWVSFQQAGVFKRVWRTYALVRAIDADATVRIQVWKDWDDEPSSDREFELVAADTEPRNLRVHLKHQKLKAIKVRVTVTSDGAGVDVMKIGFELGMRTGGPKEPRENTQ